MTSVPLRRRIVRRTVMALAGTVLLVTWYFASAPVISVIALRLPASARTPLEAFTIPAAIYYTAGPEWPGGELYRRYWTWCWDEIVDR